MECVSRDLVVGPGIALSCAETAGVPLFERCPPAHSVLIGHCRLAAGSSSSAEIQGATAIPAGTSHQVLSYASSHGGVAYLDARRFSFRDAQHLATAWSGFVMGRDDLREAVGDAMKLPSRRVDARLLRAIDCVEEGTTVVEAAARVRLSASRLTHLMSDELGVSPRAFSVWFKLQRAIHHALFSGGNLTDAAHAAGFADSAHLTRTCKQLMGVRPGRMLPQRVHVWND